jgi:hypothetical protein
MAPDDLNNRFTYHPPEPGQPIDLGHGHTLTWSAWDPDLDLNPQDAHLADRLPVRRFTAIIAHTAPDGSPCESAATPDTEMARLAGMRDHQLWQLVSDDPLTLSPSLLCGRCGDHGFVREGVWVPA